MTQHTVTSIKKMKGQHIVSLTAYTAPMARLLDKHCDIILVGDSLGMVIYGFDNTLPVSLDMMINHGKAVANNCHHALVVVDMPFGSVEANSDIAITNAITVIKETNAQAVKIEGGEYMAATIHTLTQHGIAVLGHVGLLPQHVHNLGGFKAQGYNNAIYEKIIHDAKQVEQAGAFAVVLEGVVEELARDITRELTIPVIGIGASPACDGQILVCDDMLGLHKGYLAKFVKEYAHLNTIIDDAAAQYAHDVRHNIFPTQDYCYHTKKEPTA